LAGRPRRKRERGRFGTIARGLEGRYISEVSEKLASRVALIPSQLEPPVGSKRLHQMADVAAQVETKGP
jgi:hypothetical protein